MAGNGVLRICPLLTEHLADLSKFSNIKNNLLWQIKKFATEKARYIKFRASKNTEGNDDMEYAEVDVVTD